MKSGNWVPIDKGLVKTMSTINRSYTPLEAMFSYSVDVDNGKEGTFRGYAKLWGWSVGKVKRFVECLRNTSGTVVERKGNGSGTLIRFIHGGSQGLTEHKRNSSGTVAEHKQVATIYPKPKPKEKTKRFDARLFLSKRKVKKQHITDWLQTRTGKKLKNTLTAFQAVEREAGKANLSLPEVIEKCCEESWGGFKASWLVNGDSRKQPGKSDQIQIEKEKRAMGINN